MGLSTEPVPDIQRKSPHIPPFFSDVLFSVHRTTSAHVKKKAKPKEKKGG